MGAEERRIHVERVGVWWYAGSVRRLVRIVRRSFDVDNDGYTGEPPFLNASGDQYGIEWESLTEPGSFQDSGWMTLSLEAATAKAEEITPIVWGSNHAEAGA